MSGKHERRPHAPGSKALGHLGYTPLPYGVKVYLVMLPNNVAKPGEINVKILAWKLTRASAQAIVDKMPGSYIVRGVADKL